MSDENLATIESKDIAPADTATVPADQQRLDDETVQLINSAIQETEAAFYATGIRIGRWILEKYFNNDHALAASRNPRKQTSFQRLCERPDLKVDPTTLARMVRVAVQETYLTDNIANLENLGYTNRILLLRVDDEQKKLELAQRCVAESLSTRQFDDLIDQELRTGAGEPQDEAPKNPVKFVAQMDKFLESSRKIALIKDPAKLNKLHASTKEALKKEAEKLVAHMQEITRECNELITALAGPPPEPIKKTKVRKKKE